MTNFSGLSIALAGLRSARRNMDVAAGNVANAQNPDYARRRMVTGLTPPTEGALQLSSSEGQYLQRITDEFYERRSLTEASVASRLTKSAQMLADLEQTVPEPSDTGISAKMGQLFGAFGDVTDAPGQLPVRQVAVNAAQDLVSTFHLAADQMGRVRQDTVGRMEQLVQEVNSLTARVAGLNQSIVDATAAGNDPGAFLDDRDASMRRLTELVGPSFQPGPNGTTSATLGSGTMVFGNLANRLRVTDDGTTVGLAWDGPAITGPVSGTFGGEAAAYTEFTNTTLPGRLAQLDAVAADFMTQVNALHASGYSMDGTTGLALFTGTTAANIAVDPAVAADPAKLAAGATAGPLDTSVAARIADLASAATGPLSSYRSFVSQLGSDVQVALQGAETQVGVLSQLDTARASARGVSIDEEVAAIVEYQRLYEASAKVISTIDSTMDALMSIVR